MKTIRIVLQLVIIGFLAIGLRPTILHGQELKPGRLPSEVRKSLVPGLLVEYFSPDGKLLDSNVARLPAIQLEQGEPATPFVQDRNVKIRFAGFLKLKLKGAYQFSLVGNGNIDLKVNDSPILNGAGDLSKLGTKSADLVKGYNRFEVIYSPPKTGNAKLRIYWENESFEIEPIPSIAFLNSTEENCLGKSKSLAEEIAKWSKVHHGRDLALTHNCLKCHQTRAINEIYVSRDTPDLSVAAGRLNNDWLEAWLTNPREMRNGTTMPRLLDSDDKQSIADLAAYVLSLSANKGEGVNEGDASKGGDTFENVGCIGCHHFEKPDFEDEYQRVSLFYASAKFKSGKLSEFLSDSRAHYKWSRMPKFKLDEKQCQDLESFIRSESKGKATGVQIQNTDLANGQKLFSQVGCANCHQDKNNGASVADLKSKSFDDLNSQKGCLSQTVAPGNVPRFDFDEKQVESLRVFVSTKSSSLSNLNRSYFATRSMAEMRCTTCHDLDDEQATLPYIIEEEGVVGLPPNRVPMLTYAGEKLMPNWSVDLISGKLPYKVREHFRVQMPGFPARAGIIAHGLSNIHGFASEENASLEIDAGSVEHGKAVAAMESGLSCNRCHAIADKKPNAAFDAQSTNLIYAAKRLRKEYYMRWMFDPIRIDKQTKMPRFSEDRKTTSLKTVFDGDSRQQFEALWQYLNSIKAK